MSKVSFQNNGLLDLRLLTTFGASVKVGENPIGYFGTGLKYAIAILKRLGCSVHIYIGRDCYSVHIETENIRSKDFQMLYLLGPAGKTPLPFTTELGKGWSAWSAYREIYCNVIDENGEVLDGEAEPHPDKTTIVVEGDAIRDAHLNREEIVLTQYKAKWLSRGVEILERPGRYLYYRGIRVAELPQQSLYTYNIIAEVELTEDRTIKYEWMVHGVIRDAIVRTDDPELARAILNAEGDYFEAKLDYSNERPSPVFLDVLAEELRIRSNTNTSFLSLYKRQLGRAYRPSHLEPTKAEARDIQYAMKVAKKLGLKEVPVFVTNDLHDNVLGVCFGAEAFISRRTFARGRDQVVGTVLEEIMHATLGLEDESRGMQNFLLDTIVQLVKGRRA